VAAKRSLRRQIRARRLAVSQSDRRTAGEAIARHILRELAQRPVRRWALYADLPDEVPMRALFEAIRAGTSSLPLIPRITGGLLVFVAVRSWSDLRPGPWGLLQASWGGRGHPFSADDVVLVPGLAFDRAGHRLGRGGGFYDRTFAGARRHPLLIGAGYSFQLHERVPHAASDRRVDAVVTERGIVWAGSRM
jgi:5-formyltetrahydrofolate cyclo-ligase